MSRIGKKPVALVPGITASMKGRDLVLEKGSAKLTQWIHPSVDVSIEEGKISFDVPNPDRRTKALHGTYRSLTQNMVTGLDKGFERRLTITGVGFGATLSPGKHVDMNVGYANSLRVEIPAGVTVEVPEATTVVVKGHDKQLVGQFAANVRGVRPPEPYNGKGVRYSDEVVKRKQGKTVGAGG